MSILALNIKTVKLITTTQIITSVYTAVKELIENALDADADNVEINLVDNGTSLIEVKDNGCGICKEDAPYIVLPSYTSKISTFEDLDVLQTYGFRGEALSALCAAAEVTIITKRNEDIVGISYTMDHNGQIVKHVPCHRSTGTTIQARNLFKHMPVRRQIITNARRANQSVKLLETLIHSFGICKPNVRIQFRVNNNVIFIKPSLNDIKEAVNHILDRKIVPNMEWVEPEDVDFKLQLMLPSKKVQNLSEICHLDLQYIFVNNRPIKHKNIEKVISNLVLEYFKQEIHRKKVIFLLYIILKPMDIDVNLEPNKDAILFKDQNKILDTIDRCVRKFYGFKPLDVPVEEDITHDISVSYKDCTYNSDENMIDTEWPACKKQKLQTRGKVDQKDIKQQKPIPIICNNVAKHKIVSQDIPNDKTYDSPDGGTAVLTSCLQPPNLSDSDSNDTFPTDNKMMEEHESFSQLPLVDLGEDFDFAQATDSWNTSTNKNMYNSDKAGKNDEISSEVWSKGHVIGLKGGTNITSDTAMVQLNNNVNENNETSKDNLKFLKYIRSQVEKENPALTAAQTAQKITQFWKKISSEERGYYRDIVREEGKQHQVCKKNDEKKNEGKRIDTENNKSRLLQLFEKMKKKNEKEKSNMRTTVSWIIDRNSIITRTNLQNGHVIGRLTANLWIAIICEQMWVVDITGLIKGLKVSNINIDKIEAQEIERFLKQWLLERDDMSVMYSIYEFTKKG